MKKFKKTLLPVALCASVITLTACSSISSSETYITSKAGNVTQADVLESIGRDKIARQATTLAVKKILLEKYKDKIDNTYIDKQYADLETQQGGKEKLEALLTQQGLTTDQYKEELKVRLAQAYLVNEFNNVSEDTIKEAYEKEKLHYNISHILISVKSDVAPQGLSDEDAKKKAEELLEKAKNGDDFATLAKDNSTDTGSASNGGNLGWSSEASTPYLKEFAEAAYKLKKGELSGVVKTSFGYHIIKLVDTKEISYDELKPSLVEKIATDAVNKDTTALSKAIQNLFKEYDVKGDTSDVKTYIESMFSTPSN